MGSNEYAYEYDAIGHQKSAKPKRLAAPGERDFEDVRTHGARSGVPRRSGTCSRLQSAVAAGSGEARTNAYAANALNQYTAVTNFAPFAASRETVPSYDADGNMISEAVSPGLHLPHRFITKYLDPETGMYYYGYRFYHPELGRWVSRDPIGERGGPGLYVLAGNSAVCVVDLFGLLTLVIGETIVQIVTEGEIPKFFKIGEIGHYDSGESLSCVSKACDTKAICSSLECKLTAKPVVRLHPDPKIRNEPFRWKNKEDISHEQHERNHHQVFLNVYVESYKVLVAEYEGMCCKNADKRYVELLDRYEKLKTRLKQWEFATEYFWYKTHPLPNNYDPTLDTEWGHAQPYKDYGTKKAVLKSNTPSTVACDPGGH